MRSALFGAGRAAASVLATALALEALPAQGQEPTPTTPTDSTVPEQPAPSTPPASPQSPPTSPESPPASPQSPPAATAGAPEPTAAPGSQGEAGQASSPEMQVASGLGGRVVDASNGTGMIEAPVIITGGGRTRRTQTDLDGNFEIDLPPGTYNVRSFYDLYAPQRVANVRVRRNQRTEVTIALAPTEAAQEQEVVIIAQADVATEATQLQARRESAVAQDAISYQEVRRNADTTAASAVRRVVGVTVDSNNQMVVRGLGGRYSVALMNGVPMPSTDPDLPGVQLDVIPSVMLSNLTVLKTFTPNLPGSWAGGLLDISSRSYPEELQVQFALALGANTEATFRSLLDYRGGSTDWLGIDNGTRALPGTIPDDRVLIGATRYSVPEAQQILSGFQDNWQYRTHRVMPNLTANFQIGNTHRIGRRLKLGYLANLFYNNTAERRQGDSLSITAYNSTDPSQSTIPQVYATDSLQRDVLWGALGTTSLSIGTRNDLTLLAMYTQSALDQTRRQVGTDTSSQNLDVDQWQLNWIQRSVLFVQLVGEHRDLRLPPRSELKWSAYFARSTRDQPDLRLVGYAREADTDQPYSFIDRSNASNRIFNDLEQLEGGGYLKLRMPIHGATSAELGTQVSYTTRDFWNRNFRWTKWSPPAPPEVYEEEPNVLFDDPNIGTATDIREITINTDSYHATQQWISGFGMLDTRIARRFKVVGGVRAEAFAQHIESRTPLEGEPASQTRPIVTDRTDVNWLPGIQAVYELPHSMYLRGGYGMTVARPQLRELAPYAYYDFVRRRMISGYPELVSTTIHNVDLRFEWFPTDGEVLAVSAFYKQFINPIERVILSPGTDDATFRNAAGAYDVGVEFEARLGLEHIHRALRFFSFGGNLALVKSQVRLEGQAAEVAVNPERPLINQSPYVINLSLRFDHPDSGVSVNLVYNVFGPRITDVGQRQDNMGTTTPDYIEQPFNSLDLIATWNVNEHWAVRGTFRNLLNDDRVWKQGVFVVETYRPGTTIQLGAQLSY